MRSNMLVSLKRPSTENVDCPVKKMRSTLELNTKYWPITISNTIMLNIKQYIDPLPEFIVKEKLTAGEVLQCKQVLLNLLQLEEKHVPLPLPSIGHSEKGMKRTEHYHLLWEEMETFLEYHANNSDAHMEVLEFLLAIRIKDDKVELDQALRELDSFGKDGMAGRVNLIRATIDSQMSPTTDSPMSSTTDSTMSPTTDSPMSSTTDSTMSPTTVSTMSPTTDWTMSPTTDWTMSPTTDSTMSPMTDSTMSPTTDPPVSQPASMMPLKLSHKGKS